MEVWRKEGQNSLFEDAQATYYEISGIQWKFADILESSLS